MILGPPSPCFAEIDEAVSQMQSARGDDRPVVFRWDFDVSSIPTGAVIYNFDFPGTHFGLDAMRAAAARASEVWDFSARGVSQWRALGVEAKHVPVGHHPSMKRFDRQPESKQDVDVVFVGCINERRAHVLDALESLGLRVRVASRDRAERDGELARARASLNMLYYENGVYPMLRAAHLLSNDVPFVAEIAPEGHVDPTYRKHVGYQQLVSATERAVRGQACGARSAFEATPMVLP